MFKDQQAGSFDEKKLAAALKAKVIGQGRVADQIASQLRRRIIANELSEGKTDKPLGVFCLAGPPGTGKSYFCKVLAKNMYDGKGKLHTIEMSQHEQPHTVSALIGSPQGYSGGGGGLTNALKANPKLIVLLDEFEKACSQVHKVFLSAWNDGFITDIRTTEKVSTTKSIFMLTTNASWERMLEIEKSMKDDEGARDRAFKEVLKQSGFAPEVLSRINAVFVFEPLDGLGLSEVAALEMEILADKYRLELTEVDSQYIFDTVTQERFQGLGIRELTQYLETQLSDMLIEARQGGAKAIKITYENKRPRVERDEPPPEGATDTASVKAAEAPSAEA